MQPDGFHNPPSTERSHNDDDDEEDYNEILMMSNNSECKQTASTIPLLEREVVGLATLILKEASR